eukprot:1160887-Pelagomonas_calceolata.AAC.7
MDGRVRCSAPLRLVGAHLRGVQDVLSPACPGRGLIAKAYQHDPGMGNQPTPGLRPQAYLSKLTPEQKQCQA